MTPDRLYSLPCGCDVTFTAVSNHRSAVPVWCPEHDPDIQSAERDKILAAATARRDADDAAAHKE